MVKRVIKTKVRTRPYSSYKKRMKRNKSYDDKHKFFSVARDSNYILNQSCEMRKKDKVYFLLKQSSYIYFRSWHKNQ